MAGPGDLPRARGALTGPGEAGLSVSPIGVARTPFAELALAPRQPAAARGVRGTIELFEGQGLEHALLGVEAWSHLWVLFWFHEAGETRARKVRPPRSAQKRGIFATRAPHRPNPLGLSLVRLVAVRGLSLEVEDVDLLDGTPILDLKPYVPYADVAPHATSGWLPAAADPAAIWRVEIAPRAEEQLAFLEARGEDALRARVTAALALGPEPHPYRRIRVEAGGRRVLAVKAFRVSFEVQGETLRVLDVASGHRPRDLAIGETPELALHRALSERFAR